MSLVGSRLAAPTINGAFLLPLPHRIDRVLQPARGGAFAGFVEEGERHAHQAEGDFGVSGHGRALPCVKPATCPGARRRFENRVLKT